MPARPRINTPAAALRFLRLRFLRLRRFHAEEQHDASLGLAYTTANRLRVQTCECRPASANLRVQRLSDAPLALLNRQRARTDRELAGLVNRMPVGSG